jgi:GGDEF-like domain/PucR C-terminal helix-turn-helix domain
MEFDALRLNTARAAADEAGGVDPALLGDFLADLADVAESGAALPDRALAACRALGARAADDGVPLRALVDLYLSAAWRIWPDLPAVRAAGDAAGVRAVGTAVLRASDAAVAAAAEGFQAARRFAIRREESARREFVDDLLGGTGDIGALSARAEEFGLDLGGSHVLAVCTATTPFVDATPLVSRVEDAVARAAGVGDTLVTTKEGLLACVLPAGSADGAVESLATSMRRGLGAGGWRIGVGRPYPGAAGVLRSYEEARDALDVAARLDLPGQVVRSADLLVYQVLLRDRAAITDLIDTVLSPLTTARGGARPLLDTLIAYSAHGGNTAATARSLHLAVRTVTYRLDRVAALTGYDAARPDDRYVLQTAVLGARLLDWP